MRLAAARSAMREDATGAFTCCRLCDELPKCRRHFRLRENQFNKLSANYRRNIASGFHAGPFVQRQCAADIVQASCMLPQRKFEILVTCRIASSVTIGIDDGVTSRTDGGRILVEQSTHDVRLIVMGCARDEIEKQG